MYILGANMYHLRYQYAAFGYKSVPFEKVQPQWQLLYLFFWECNKVPFSKFIPFHFSFLCQFVWLHFHQFHLHQFLSRLSQSDKKLSNNCHSFCSEDLMVGPQEGCVFKALIMTWRTWLVLFSHF